jgi:hypothetical protein
MRLSRGWKIQNAIELLAPVYVLIFSLLLFIPVLPGQQQGNYKRLILKDGSYESVGKYEIRGDRVHYFSTERNAWEEIPSSLVDWAATEQSTGQTSRDSSEHLKKLQEGAAEARKEEEAHAPLVAPGIRVPSPDGVYLLDVYKGVPELNPLFQNGADLNKNTRANILRSVINPIAGPKQTIELKGPHASIHAHSSSPSIYFPIDPGDPSIGYNSTTAQDHIRVVRCREKNGNRVVSALDIAIYGKVKQKTDFLDVKVETVSEYWVKVTPVVPMPIGEFALVEFDGKGRMNQFVWDFGVDPAASANPDPQRASQDRGEPVLLKKPKKSQPSK